VELFPKQPPVEIETPERQARRPQPDAVPCDICGMPMQEHHCKLVCHACGFMRDCSDP
jgi:hypothetical protein